MFELADVAKMVGYDSTCIIISSGTPELVFRCRGWYSAFKRVKLRLNTDYLVRFWDWSWTSVYLSKKLTIVHCCVNGMLITKDKEELGFSSSFCMFSQMSCDVSVTKVKKDYTEQKKIPAEFY